MQTPWVYCDSMKFDALKTRFAKSKTIIENRRIILSNFKFEFYCIKIVFSSINLLYYLIVLIKDKGIVMLAI